MNRIVTGYQIGTRTVTKQNPITKLDFLKAKLVIKLLILGAFIVGLSLFYTWSRIQIVQMGYEINEYKKEQGVLIDDNKKFKMELSLMKTPKRIKHFAGDKLKMTAPDQEKIIEVK